MPGSFRIGKIAGIEIDINVSWIIILVLLSVSLATGWFPQLYPGWSTATYWIVGLISALLLFVSVLLHELAHSLVARRRGLPVKSITLFIFGGVSNIEQEPKSPGVEFQMAVVGPLTSLLIGAVCFLLQLPLRGTNSPLDGIWLGFIGWFLLSAAQSANTQVMLQSALRGVTVGEVMNPTPPTVPANISLQKLIDEYFLPRGLRFALVIQGDRLAGLITLSDIRHVPREQWEYIPVSQAMIPVESLHVVSPQQSLNVVLPLMAGRDVNQLPVVQNGIPVGIVSRDAIMRYLEVRRSLGSGTPKGDGGKQP